MAASDTRNIDAPPLVSEGARRWALALLFIAYVFNYIDRQVIVILQEPIKAELGLSDTQLGLITGLSFALFYALMGVPIARLADRYSRKGIIALSTLVWSLMTALCAAAGNFIQLLLFRIGVGTGEAGLTPTAHSLISDYYPPQKRAAALAIYSAAGSAGLMVGFLAGGWINEFFGWRMALVAVGLPGVLLAALIWWTMREPRRGQYDAAPAAQADMTAGFGALLRNPAFVLLVLGIGCHTFVTYGIGNWAPPFFMRMHGMSTGELGTWLALMGAGPGVIGMISTGYIADRLARTRPHAHMEVALATIVLIVPFHLLGLMAESVGWALAGFAGSFFFGGAYLGPSIAAAHAMVRNNLRATASALLMLGVNLLGFGLGPFAAGILSDGYTASMGEEAIRYALVSIVPLEGLAMVLFLLAIRANRQPD